EADALFARLDAAYPAEAGYDKTAFRIDCIFQGEPDSYEGRQDFGDRDGSLIEHIQSYHQFYAQDENWKKHVIATTGIEGWEQDKAHRDMLLGEFVPYMKLHCSLAQMEQTAQGRLQSGETLTPEETAYLGALLSYVQECRPMLNQGQYQLPEPPKLADFDQSLQDYKAQVQAEIAQ
ncbi:TPA: LPD25 domain-containing protein, partial [Enterococcus faecium]